MDEMTCDLPAKPIDIVKNLLSARGYETTNVPVNAAALKGNVFRQNSVVSRGVVPEEAQNALRDSDVSTHGGMTGWMVAWFEVSGLTPDALIDVFDRVVAASLEQERDRNGDSEVTEVIETVIAQTAATEVVKRIWTTHVVESSIAQKLGTPDAPEDYVEAVRREKNGVDLRLTDGTEKQVKSEAGSAEEAEMVWTQNFEDYFDKTQIVAKVE
jgi:hypothetical protein